MAATLTNQKEKSFFFLLINIIYILSILINIINCEYPIDKNVEQVFNPTEKCPGILTPEITNKLETYIPIVNEIVTKLSTDPKWVNKTWNDLADFIDTTGPRIAGTNGEKRGIEYFYKKLSKLDYLEVHKEKVTMKKQIWGDQKLKMLKPRTQEMDVICAKGSIGTIRAGIVAEAVVINSMEELKAKRPDELIDKIIIFNNDYKKAAGFYSAETAARNIFNYIQSNTKACAYLTSSLTPFSMYTLHVMYYNNSGVLPKIPIATITVEDSQMLDRIYHRGIEPIVLYLNLDLQTVQNVNSWNIVANLKNPIVKKPNELIGIAGHIDNVALGLGAIDDGVGPIFVKNIFELFKALNLNPRQRTIRGILFTSEEWDLQGAFGYIKSNDVDIKNFKALLEADGGISGLDGYKVRKNPVGFNCFLFELMNVLFPTKKYQLIETELLRTDVNVFNDKSSGLIGAGVVNGDRSGKHRWYYHTASDTMAVVEPDWLKECFTVLAVSSYVLADFEDLPF